MSFICTQPFDRNIWSSLFHLFFLCAWPFDQKLVSSLIYFFYLYTTVQPKLGVTLTLKFILFLIVPNFVCSTAFIFPPLQSYLYISYTIFIEVLLLYFVRYIHGFMKSYPLGGWRATRLWSLNFMTKRAIVACPCSYAEAWSIRNSDLAYEKRR